MSANQKRLLEHSCLLHRIFAALAMTFRHTSAFPRRDAPEVLHENCPSRNEGAGNTGCTLPPRSRVQKCTTKTHTSIQVQRRQSGIPCAMVLRLISCSPRRSGFLATVASGVTTADLTPASRRQDHTSSPSAAVYAKGFDGLGTRPPKL